MWTPPTTPWWIRTTVRSAAVRRVVRDVLLVLAVLAVLAFPAGPFSAGQHQLPLAKISLVLGLFTGMAGVAATLLAVLAARLTRDRRLAWLGMALGWYSLVAVPTGTIRTLVLASGPATDTVRIFVYVVITGLLGTALLGLRPPTGWQALGALLGGAGAVAGAGALGTALPASVHSVAAHKALQLGVIISAASLALAIAVLAVRRRAWALWYVALGFTMIGLAHAARVGVAASPVAELGLQFSTLRFGGVLLALWGTLLSARRALLQLDDERARSEEELRLAGVRIARTAERDHELRSGLAGIAGATTLLGTNCPDVGLLGAAVASELSRLDDLLRAPVGVRNEAAGATYAVPPVLSGLVALRRSSGMDLRLDTDPDLCAVGSPATLAQVITNLIANAARHAPGSPVRICATQRNGRVVIQVRDFGPGVPPGHEREVFQPGVHDGRLGGLGLGLHICHTLLSAEHGCICIHPTVPERPGCTVVVELQGASAASPTSQTSITAGVSCTF